MKSVLCYVVYVVVYWRLVDASCSRVHGLHKSQNAVAHGLYGSRKCFHNGRLFSTLIPYQVITSRNGYGNYVEMESNDSEQESTNQRWSVDRNYLTSDGYANAEEEEPDYDDDKNDLTVSTASLAEKLYDALFFYGLETPKLGSNRRKKLKEALFAAPNELKSRRMRRSPFFTPSEQLGLYLLRKIKSNNNIDVPPVARSRNDNSRRSSVYENKREDSSADENEVLPYDPMNYNSISLYASKVRRYICILEQERAVLEVTLTAEEEEDSCLSGGVNNRLLDLSNRIGDLKEKINNAKIELVNIKILLDDFT